MGSTANSVIRQHLQLKKYAMRCCSKFVQSAVQIRCKLGSLQTGISAEPIQTMLCLYCGIYQLRSKWLKFDKDRSSLVVSELATKIMNQGRFLELFTGKTNSRAILLEIEVNVCPLLCKGQILSFKGYYWIIGQIRPL